MSEEEQMNLMLVGMVSKMPDNERNEVNAAADELRTVIAKHGKMGTIAFSLVGTEIAMRP